MFVDYRQIKTVDKETERRLFANCKRLKHRAIILLMLDSGLRVTEAVRMKWENVKFIDSAIVVESLKKRGDSRYRSIPMTSKLLDVLSEMYSEADDRSDSAFLFPSRTTKTGHMSRKSAWHIVKRLSGSHVYPHMLRHTFASRIVNEGGDIRAAKEMLGHTSVSTTEIYTHATIEAKRSAIELLEPRGWYRKLLKRVTSSTKPKVYKIQKYSDYSNYHVGRKREIKVIENYANRKINTLVLGKQGIGKSHLLSRFRGDKVIRLDDMSSVKSSLGHMLLTLYDGDKQAVLSALTDNANINNVASRQSVKRLTELLVKATRQQEYTLIIDDLTSVTKQGVAVLENLKNHFHIIAAARQIKLSHQSFATNFEKIRIGPLSRGESMSLIGHHSRDIYKRIEDYDLYSNHVHEHSGGNPLFTIELCRRFEKEPILDVYTIRNISHTDSVKEIDASSFVVIALSSLMVLRYIGGEFGSDQSGAFRLFGGVFFVIAIFARSIFQFAKRKTI